VIIAWSNYRLATVTHEPRATAFLRQSLSVAIQRGNAFCVTGTFRRSDSAVNEMDNWTRPITIISSLFFVIIIITLNNYSVKRQTSRLVCVERVNHSKINNCIFLKSNIVQDKKHLQRRNQIVIAHSFARCHLLRTMVARVGDMMIRYVYTGSTWRTPWTPTTNCPSIRPSYTELLPYMGVSVKWWVHK